MLHPVAAGVTPPVHVPVRAIAGNWGIAPRRVVRLGGNRNVHWIVHAPDGQFVLRCYRRDREPAAVAYEFAVIAYLAAEGWPVAEPVGPVSVWNGRTFALFPRLPGRRSRSPELAAGADRRGALLGRLHRDLNLLAIGQRAGWCRLDEFIAAEAGQLIGNARARLHDQPELREVFVRHTVATHDTLTTCPSDLPRSVIHGDFAPWNLLWRDGRLTGLIDFDDVRLDLRATDLAIARRRDREGVVEGYRGCARLSDEEHVLLAPLWRAYTLRFVADLLRAPVMTPQVNDALQWCARQLEQTVPTAAGLPLGLPETLAPRAGELAGQLCRDNKRGYLRLDPSQIPMVLLSAPGVPALTDGIPLTGVDADLVLAEFQAAFSPRGAGARLADAPGAW
jgi:Ser/Thr protein kinase RdoA (MazF antagonist)